ncbi:MAG: hypothetical protein NZ908_02770 [Candidatus Micrarchaeota archaeon]|nr:hypothetical protein [Candidatus Micrarchaeota archaeon]MCX8154768.1 hypothetical protein [Candidatus Micrarchaeota archaeon]
MINLLVMILIYMIVLQLIAASIIYYTYIPTRMIAIDVAIARDAYMMEVDLDRYKVRSQIAKQVFTH